MHLQGMLRHLGATEALYLKRWSMNLDRFTNSALLVGSTVVSRPYAAQTMCALRVSIVLRCGWGVGWVGWGAALLVCSLYVVAA